mgnify:CR=1 FL=1
MEKKLLSRREGPIKGSLIISLEKEEVIEIATGDFVEVLTLERLALPKAICTRIGLRSYYTRKGYFYSVSPNRSGFEGYLIVSLFNTGLDQSY